MSKENNTIEQLFDSVRNDVVVPSYAQFSQIIQRPIKSPTKGFVTKMQLHRKTYGWMIRSIVLASIALVVILPVVYSGQGGISFETQIVSDEAEGEIALLEQEDLLIGNSVDNMLNQLLMMTNN